MLLRVTFELANLRIAMINNEAHYCYREKPDSDETLSADKRAGPPLGLRPRRLCPPAGRVAVKVMKIFFM